MSTFELSSVLPTASRSDSAQEPLKPSPEILVLAAAPSQDDDTRPILLIDGAVGTGVDTDALAGLLPRLGFTGGQDAVQHLPASVVTDEDYEGPEILLVVGLGAAWANSDPALAGTVDDEAALGADRAGLLRRAAGRASRALAGCSWAVMALPTLNDTELASVIQGAALGAYRWSGREGTGSSTGSTGSAASSDSQDTQDPAAATSTSAPGAATAGGAGAPKAPVERVTVLSPLASGPEAEEALSFALALAEATTLARDLVNEPPNRLTPQAFAQRAVQVAEEASVTAEVWDEHALAQEGFGGILAVGQGSDQPPRLVRLEWAPPQAEGHVALIGKGITFDSGGLSLKPPASMPEMKSDMAGAAAVLGAVLAAARLELPVRVTGWLALAENMPGPGAQRPSDIITMLSGKTVEVTNTDAEGRLVMADALARAVTEQPDAVLDVATLTGAQIVALGDHVAGVMGTPTLREEVVAAAQRAGEAFWPMPLPSGLRPALKSTVADLINANTSSRAGGMLTAGLFLREFVGDTPWAHLDVAGPAFNDKSAWGLTPSGGTGMGVATLLELLRSRALTH
ncbi:leucyl aminopeptidase [Actinomyces capricornis]|uniref:Probable cytosol aminopeptidase n=1 Tax=Actinomyces capricornis TaxID=2755559 RepID=A0ABM7UQ28_9ACTO|nr:leucyl aminopeptidase [Actinomyces capricornis]BDA65632.1 putative cytosol aminopeptidase [Actinomyces capricornis]